jgi:DNA-binding CsgD family transcriptional regulator
LALNNDQIEELRSRRSNGDNAAWGEHHALTPDAVTVYKYALATPGWTGPDAPAALGLDGRRLAAAMRVLRAYHLVRPSTEPGREWEPVGPEAALVELVGDDEIRLRRRQASITRVRHELLGLLPAYLDARRRHAPDDAIDTVPGYARMGGLIDEHIRRASGDICVAVPGQKIDEIARLPVFQPGALDGKGQVRVLLEDSVRTHRQAKDGIAELCQPGRAVRTVPRIPYEIILFGRTSAFLPDREPHRPSVAVVRHPVIVGSLWGIFDLLWHGGEEVSEEPGQKEFRDEISRTVLRHLAAGEKDEVIARRLGLSVRTCRRHIAAIMDELGATSRFQAGVLAQRRATV